MVVASVESMVGAVVLGAEQANGGIGYVMAFYQELDLVAIFLHKDPSDNSDSSDTGRTIDGHHGISSLLMVQRLVLHKIVTVWGNSVGAAGVQYYLEDVTCLGES